MRTTTHTSQNHLPGANDIFVCPLLNSGAVRLAETEILSLFDRGVGPRRRADMCASAKLPLLPQSPTND